MTRHLKLVPELPEPAEEPLKKATKQSTGGTAPGGKRKPGATLERPPSQFWRTTGFTRLAVPLAGVLGGKTAKAFES